VQGGQSLPRSQLVRIKLTCTLSRQPNLPRQLHGQQTVPDSTRCCPWHWPVATCREAASDCFPYSSAAVLCPTGGNGSVGVPSMGPTLSPQHPGTSNCILLEVLCSVQRVPNAVLLLPDFHLCISDPILHPTQPCSPPLPPHPPQLTPPPFTHTHSTRPLCAAR
jgi:hypothetical protein